ncbi:MAG: lipoyl(octanoyl) transferase LipB [Gammaproteobacteria bacterium]|nr:lipoyl(octanoyl) transferase LipB [Gammaproteobacteria bacterium]
MPPPAASTSRRPAVQPARPAPPPPSTRRAVPPPEPQPPTLEVTRLGLVDYARALDLQAGLVRRRAAGEIPDQLLLLEHPHVVTLGSSAHRDHVLASDAQLRERGIELFEAGRGGDVTYHGPGQLVGYPILRLGPERRDLHRYLRDLEEVLIRALAAFGVPAARAEGLTGVWTGGRKIAAIGIRVSSGWVTSHGFALNVDPDLGYFTNIVPCGIRGREVTSLAECNGGPVPMAAVEDAVVSAFAEVLAASPAQRPRREATDGARHRREISAELR